MSSQARLENVLRDIHVMISKSEMYDTDRIIVSKQDIFNLIDRLNASIYEIMDEYELTQQSRDRALREKKKEGDKIIWDASRQAEDIYAASVLYTEEALNHLNVMVDEADATVDRMYREFCRNIKQQQETIRENQLELKSQLQLLADTEKYLRLIEERNREIERERAEKKGRKTLENFGEKHTVIKPEIKINEEYFRKAGIPFEKEEEHQPEEDLMQPLEDEGVIESTLKRAAADIQQIFSDEKLTEKNGRREKEKANRSEKESADDLHTDASEEQKAKHMEKGADGNPGKLMGHDLEEEGSVSEQASGTSADGKGDADRKSNPIIQAVQQENGEKRLSEEQDDYLAKDDLDYRSGYADQEVRSSQAEKVPGSRQDADSKLSEDAEIKVNLDAEYFKQKSSDEDEMPKQHREKMSLLDKLMGKKKTLL